VGGFGQGDAEIVLQDPLRVQGLLFFLGSVVLAQIFLVLKKEKQPLNGRCVIPLEKMALTKEAP
jgi:hypothetical protein